MFVVRVHFIAILNAIAQQCRLSYMSTVREILEDETHLYRIELELPRLFDGHAPRIFYFWAHHSDDPEAAYEDAADKIPNHIHGDRITHC